MTTETTTETYARRWGNEERPEHPAPEVPCRLALAEEIPASARRMATSAQGAGWAVVATYARGTTLGRVLKVVDSLALRLARDERRAAAVWLDGKFSCAVRWGSDTQLQSVGMRELAAWLVTA